MSQYTIAGRTGVDLDGRNPVETATSGVAWPAILGGTAAALALSLVLVTIGSGFGLAAISPWRSTGVSATTFAVATGVWLIVVQWLASALGGYITGRMRTKWVGLHTHEVFFRDTANGFLTWATASVLGAVLLVSAAGVTASSTMTAGNANGNQTTVSADPAADSNAYFVDTLFRSDRATATAPTAEERAEATRILVNGVRTNIPADDATYLSAVVSAHTGLSPQDAMTRVVTTEVRVRQAADAARKAGAALAIFTGLSMLIGAFIASAAAALGGLQRDEY